MGFGLRVASAAVRRCLLAAGLGWLGLVLAHDDDDDSHWRPFGDAALTLAKRTRAAAAAALENHNDTNESEPLSNSAARETFGAPEGFRAKLAQPRTLPRPDHYRPAEDDHHRQRA